MAYVKQTWIDEDVTYPLSAARMLNLEDGIKNAHDTADQSVLKTGNETISGVKTFNAPPIVPDPVGVGDAVNKFSMDEAITNAFPVNGYFVYVATGDDSNLSAAINSAPVEAQVVLVPKAGT